MEMNKLSSNITKIVEKWNDFKESSEKDRKYLVKQIDKIHDGFFEAVYAGNMTIVEEPTGKHQGKGQYCLCQVLVGKFPYLFLLSLFFYFFVSQISPGYALNRYFSLVAKYKIS